MVLYSKISLETLANLVNALQRGKFMYDEDFAIKYKNEMLHYFDGKIGLMGKPISKRKFARYKKYKVHYIRYKRKSSSTNWYAYYISKNENYLVIKIANNHTDHAALKGLL